jgi:transcriptional regulator with XRE-family HTH domain
VYDARKAAGLTQERLAERSDLSRVTIVRMETGRQSPRLDHLIMVADALGVTVSHLVQDL